MTLFDQIKFIREWYQALVKQKGKAPNHPDLARTLPSSGTMSHKWSDVTVLRKILVVAQLEEDVSEVILFCHHVC